MRPFGSQLSAIIRDTALSIEGFCILRVCAISYGGTSRDMVDMDLYDMRVPWLVSRIQGMISRTQCPMRLVGQSSNDLDTDTILYGPGRYGCLVSDLRR